ncbi:MAG: hypothetical protein LBJ00_13685 [Planctomycetaceae bacterium]|jgi:hypothetical protein|nr:hypothetical protein [Planctomycetaceae bacterium]
MKRRDLLQTIFWGLSIPSSLLSAVYCAELPDEIAVADKLFKKSKFAEAREIYKKFRNLSATKNQADNWKYCTLQIVRCSRRLCDLSLAVEEYFQYCRIDSAASLETIPIIWSTSSSLIQGTKPNSQSSLNLLRQITSSNYNPAAELLAASVLAAEREPSLRNTGLHHLQKLANPHDSESNNTEKNSNPQPEQTEPIKILANNVMLLAGVLLWKERIPILRNEKELTSLRRHLERIPEPLRAGAFFWYGKATAQLGLLDEAVIEIMKIPIQYPEDTVLVLDALEEAAKILDKLNRKNQAEQLRNEKKELLNEIAKPEKIWFASFYF